MTKAKPPTSAVYLQPRVPAELHRLMYEEARQDDVSGPEAFRRALRWAAREDAWGLVVDDAGTKRFDLVLTPALGAELDRRVRLTGLRESQVIAQAASAWLVHRHPPAWWSAKSTFPRFSETAASSQLTLHSVLSLRPQRVGAIAAALGVSWATAFSLLRSSGAWLGLHRGEVVACLREPSALGLPPMPDGSPKVNIQVGLGVLVEERGGSHDAER